MLLSAETIIVLKAILELVYMQRGRKQIISGYLKKQISSFKEKLKKN